jgi:hypothetical protein
MICPAQPPPAAAIAVIAVVQHSGSNGALAAFERASRTDFSNDGIGNYWSEAKVAGLRRPPTHPEKNYLKEYEGGQDSDAKRVQFRSQRGP